MRTPLFLIAVAITNISSMHVYFSFDEIIPFLVITFFVFAFMDAAEFVKNLNS